MGARPQRHQVLLRRSGRVDRGQHRRAGYSWISLPGRNTSPAIRTVMRRPPEGSVYVEPTEVPGLGQEQRVRDHLAGARRARVPVAGDQRQPGPGRVAAVGRDGHVVREPGQAEVGRPSRRRRAACPAARPAPRRQPAAARRSSPPADHGLPGPRRRGRQVAAAGPAGWPRPPPAGQLASERSVKARFRDVARPKPNVTAAAPNATAAAVTSVRAGRAKGAASPSVTVRGSALSRASARCAP